jgi:hypothetical protein
MSQARRATERNIDAVPLLKPHGPLTHPPEHVAARV